MSAARRPSLSIVAPKSLREALSVSYTYRERVRWLAGTSPLLGLDFTRVPADARIIDVRTLRELTATPGLLAPRIRFGAFASEEQLRADPDLRNLLFDEYGPALRLAIGDAIVEVAGLGRVRRVALDEIGALAEHELPVTIELDGGESDVRVFRKQATTDGNASFRLLVAAGFRVDAARRIERARVAVVVADGAPRRMRAVERLLEGRVPASERFAEAARLCASEMPSVDAPSAAAARACLPLALALFREARVRCDEMNRNSPKR